MPRSLSSPPKDVAVLVGLDLVGDGLIKLPFLRALKAAWPEARIHWITAQGPTAYGTVLRGATRGLIHAIHEQPVWLATTANPAARDSATAPRFDLVLDTRNRWREARLARKSLPHGLFIALAARHLLSDRRPGLFTPRPPRLIDRLLHMVELAAGAPPSVSARLPIAPDLLAQAETILLPERPYIGFAPGAGNMVKAWPQERFAEVACHQARKGRVPVFLLGPAEEAWRDSLSAAVPDALFPLQARDAWGDAPASVERTLAVASLLTAAVANDSGTSHMLAAVDCPLVSLFGPTSPVKLAPKVSKAIVIRAQTYGRDSMEAIPVKAVDDAIERLVV